MNYGIVAAAIAAILLVVKYMIGRARTDSILADLGKANDQKRKESFDKEAARLEQEILDAKLDYTRIRDRYKSSGPGGGDAPPRAPTN